MKVNENNKMEEVRAPRPTDNNLAMSVASERKLDH